MTNQPDESHPLRDRVDEAISWFTQTNEPPEPNAAPVTEPSAPVAEASTPVSEAGTPVVGERTSPGTGSGPGGAESAAVVGTHAAEPVADVAPARAIEDASLNTPVAADLPGNEAAPVALHQEPATEAPVAEPVMPTSAAPEPVTSGTPVVTPPLTQTEVAPERVYEADEFSSHPIASSIPAAAPADVAPERLSEADDFVPDSALTPAAVVPVVEAQPVAVGPVESSDVDEPTRIHPIEPPPSWAEVHPEAKGLTAAEVEAESEARAASQRSLFRDEAPTVALPADALAPSEAAPVLERTAVLDAAESARLRREERAARDRQLGKVISAPDDSDEPLVTKFAPPTTYKGLPSVGLALFRLVLATVIGIRAWQHISHLTATRSMWAATIVPSPGVVAWTQIGIEIAIAIMLLIGLGTHIAGLALLVLSVAVLVFVQWGVVSPFQPGAVDFIGVVDVLLAGAGILLSTVGGGRIAFDGAFHTSRLRRKNDKLFA